MLYTYRMPETRSKRPQVDIHGLTMGIMERQSINDCMFVRVDVNWYRHF